MKRYIKIKSSSGLPDPLSQDFGEYLQQKYQSDNTNKIIVSQDFGRGKYSKNIMIIYVYK